MKKNYFLTLLLTLFISGLSFGQGLEDFANSEATSSYSDGSFVGNSGITWSYVASRDANNDNNNSGISLPALMLRRVSSGSKITSSTISGGIGNFSVKLYKGFTGGGDRQVELFVNGVSQGTSTAFDNYDEQVFSVPNINITGDVIIEIVNTTAKQVIIDDITWTTPSSDPSISIVGSISSLDYYENNGPSPEGTFTVSGSSLTSDIIVSSPTNFEVSLTTGSGFSNSVNITQTAGSVDATTVYTRLISGLSSNTYSGDITASSSGATDVILSVTGVVSPADPQITVTAFLDDFNYIISVGGPSPEDSFSVEGLFLQDDISVTAPANYEVSLTTATGFASSVSITPDQAGTVASTEVFVRLAAGLSAGNYTGNISVSSTGVTEELIAVNGNAYGAATNSMVITGAYDGPLSGGTPKGIELYVLQDISDLSLYGISSITNGQGSSSGNVEYNFPADAVTAGTYIYLATESSQFTTFFGIAPTYTNGVVSINGDDSIELYENGQIIDTFGDVNTDGSGEAWDYLDGWAYRNSNTGPEGTTFTPTNWSYSGANAFDGESDNASATTPFPIGTYSNTPPPSGNTVTVATSQAWNAYVNAFNVSDNGYAFGFPYTVSDLRATPTATSMTLEPNTAIWTAEASNSAWFDQGATTQTALLYIEASSFIEDNTLAGSDLTFTGNVSVSDLGSEYTVVAFVKALDPNAGYATVVNNTADISSTGDFTASATAAELASGYIIQYGFAVTGPLADPADTTLGSVVIGEATAGVDDNSFVNVSVYPNPSNSNWNFRTGNTVITSVEVFNLLGKRVVSQNNNSTEIVISTQGLTSGIYIARITTEQGVKSVKLIRE